MHLLIATGGGSQSSFPSHLLLLPGASGARRANGASRTGRSPSPIPDTLLFLPLQIDRAVAMASGGALVDFVEFIYTAGEPLVVGEGKGEEQEPTCTSFRHHVCIHLCRCTHVHVCKGMYVHIYIYVYAYMCIMVYMLIHTYIYIYILDTYIYICVYVLVYAYV